jgi:hypothetical protein
VKKTRAALPVNRAATSSSNFIDVDYFKLTVKYA